MKQAKKWVKAYEFAAKLFLNYFILNESLNVKKSIPFAKPFFINEIKIINLEK